MSQRPITNPRAAAGDFCWTAELDETLRQIGCHGCDLGFQPNINGCCVMRGSHSSPMMIVGEGPGKEEDSRRLPFTGPAGRLMDKIWRSVDLDTNDFYCTNAVLCRPVAPWEAKKQNLTPKVEQLKRCKPYLERQIQLLNPRLIVTLGRIAAEAILGPVASMRAVRGQQFLVDERIIFPMYHPAAILHASHDVVKQQFYKEKTWDDIQRLKEILIEENLI